MHIMQEASGRSVDRIGARPTIISREMHIAMTAMYDAWAAYDATAVGTRLPSVFVTPPFPGYTSGHATASGAASKILELVTGSDRYDCIGIRKAGELTGLGCSVGEMQARGGAVDPALKDDREVRLKLPTFSATAEMPALSRMLGGYHISTDNNVGLEVGRKVAVYSWPKYQAYFGGTATVRDQR
jgi:hypothetical protein